MNLKGSVVFGSMLISAALAAGAQPAGEFAADHMMNMIKLRTCRSTYELGELKRSSGEMTAIDAYKSFLTCMSGVNEGVTATYNKMVLKLKSKSQKSALKDYQVAVKLAVDGSEPKSGELESQHKARVARLDEDVERNWQRLMLE